MKLVFLGTRGGIKARSPLHMMNSSLLISYLDTTILIDWGHDWLNCPQPAADALLITHAHDDHVGGLANGASWPVYASKESWAVIDRYPIKDRHTIVARTPFWLGSLLIEPFAIHHSLKAPALGYRISSKAHTLFYISDVASIKDEQDALTNITLYIGDGALTTRTMLLRIKGHSLIGHAPIAYQLEWCQKYDVPQAIFTHCGTEIVTGDLAYIEAKVNGLAHLYSIPTMIAYDGMTITL